MKCCILGGGGFIGINLYYHLEACGWGVRSFGRRSAPDHWTPAYHIEGEFSDSGAMLNAVDGCDVVFHLIGATNPITSENNKILDLRDNVENSLRLLDQGAKGAFGRLVFLSSGGTVYGAQSVTPIFEDASQWPTSSYGVNKIAIEKYLFLYHHNLGLDYVIGRLSNPYGNYQTGRKGQGVVAALFNSAICRKPFPLVGDGLIVRDYLFIDDAVEAVEMLARYTGKQKVFNIGSGVGHTILDVIEVVEEVLGRPIERVDLPSRSVDVPCNVLDVTRAATELGWRPKTSLNAGLHRTYDWISRNVTF